MSDKIGCIECLKPHPDEDAAARCCEFPDPPVNVRALLVMLIFAIAGWVIVGKLVWGFFHAG